MGELESYDQRELSQPIITDDYDAANAGDAYKDDASTHGYGQSSDSDIEDVNNPSIEDEIPRQIYTGNVDDDKNPYFNLWSKMYQNSNTWARNSDGSILVAVAYMLIDKDWWRKVIREFAIQEGFCLRRIKNEK